MLQSVSGIGVHATRLTGDPLVHQLSLSFARDRFRVLRQDPPWKVVRAFVQPGSPPLVHVNNVSGGVLSGDRLALDVDVEAGAAAQITTTGATRLYRHRAGAADSEQCARFCVGDGGLLEYLPDAVIPYTGSRHKQSTEIWLGRGSTLFWWDVFACGRQAAGERFAFDLLRVHNAVYAGSRPVLREDYLLEPALKDLAAIPRMFDYSHTASLCVVQEGRTAPYWRALEGQLNELACEKTQPGQAVWGASALVSDGVVIRGLAMSGRFIYSSLVEFWKSARLAVTGQDAVPPRKIY